MTASFAYNYTAFNWLIWVVWEQNLGTCADAVLNLIEKITF